LRSRMECLRLQAGVRYGATLVPPECVSLPKLKLLGRLASAYQQEAYGSKICDTDASAEPTKLFSIKFKTAARERGWL
jgi:hypothetical protein